MLAQKMTGDRKGGADPLPHLVGRATCVLEWSGRIIVAVSLAVMFIALFINVVLRYIFGAGIAWAYEIHAVLLPWLIAGGLVMAAARGRNITITLASDLLSGRARLILSAVVRVCVLAICVSVLWSSQPILKASQFQTLSTLGITQVWGYASLFYAFGAMALVALFDLVRIVAGADRTRTQEPT